MSPAEPSKPADATPRGDAPRPFLLWQSFTRFLYSQNPFYLLSVACVLHSTKLWYRDAAGPYDPWPLMGVICGYILLLAVTGFVLVRFGRVWDDARSILLMLLLLFVELSLTFDGVLISQRATGTTLLLLGWGLSVVVSEGLLLGLKMRLPTIYRVPYHLFLSLLFLYPLFIVLGYGDQVQSVAWRIYFFSPVAALILLTLLPAIRRGARAMQPSGTPWPWPLYPWSLFVFLGVCVTLRSYALSLSFDPVLSQNLTDAMRLESAFGGYFLVPLLLALGVLLLEAGLTMRRAVLRWLALGMPLLCLALSIPRPSPSPPYEEFLQRYTAAAGAPLWIAALAAVAYYAYARIRGVREAETLCLGALALGAFVPRSGTPWALSLDVATTWLVMLAVLAGVIGFKRNDSRWGFIAAVALCGIVRFGWLSESHWPVRDGVPVHLLALAMLLLGAWFDDPFSQMLKQAGGAVLLVGSLVAATLPASDSFPELSDSVRVAYGAASTTVAFLYAYATRTPLLFFVGVLNGIVSTGRLLYLFAALLQRQWRWEGAGYFILGMAWFALAVLISLAKAGVLKRWEVLVPRASPRPPQLGGTP